MTPESLRSVGQQARLETQQFIAEYWIDPEAAWSRQPDVTARRHLGDCRGLRVGIGGLLCLDQSVHLDQTSPEFVRAMLSDREKVRTRWTTNVNPGGFPVGSIRSARPKGAAIELGVPLPRVLPVELERFLVENGLPSDGPYQFDGPLPHTLVLVFKDGVHRLLVDAGTDTPPAASLPRRDCDVLLLNPGPAARRSPLLAYLRRLVAEKPHCVVGVVARGDWTAQDWEALRDTGIHVFLNQRELADALGCSEDVEPLHLLTRLRSLVQGYTVTVTCGGRGALILDDCPSLLHVPAACVETVRLSMAGDVCCTTTMLAEALGHSTQKAACLAALDAARWVSGREPAASLTELEEELQLHPELTPLRLGFPAVAA